VYKLIFGFTFNVFLALMINEFKFRNIKNIVQTLVYLQFIMSLTIPAGIVQVFLSSPAGADPSGMINQIIAATRGAPVDFLLGHRILPL